MRRFVIIPILLHVAFTEARKLPSFVKTCHRNDPNLSECWKDSMMSLVPKLINGIPEMGLRPIDPVLVPSLTLDFGGSRSMQFKASLTNLTLYGCGRNINVVDVRTVYTDEGIIVEQNLTFPELYLKSKFKANGQVMLFRFDTVGKFDGNLTNIDVTGFWKSKNVIMKDGKVHGVFEESFVKVKMGGIFVEFDKLMGDNPELNANINRIINENIDILYDELRPVVEEIIDTLVKDSINKVYELFPMDDLYPV